jgi:hypothetical protein
LRNIFFIEESIIKIEYHLMPDRMKNNYRPESSAVICQHVFHASRDVMLVTHETDGMWQLLCGKPDCGSHTTPRLVGLNHLLERDPSLAEVVSLPMGYYCERKKVGGPWTRGLISNLSD